MSGLRLPLLFAYNPNPTPPTRCPVGSLPDLDAVAWLKEAKAPTHRSRHVTSFSRNCIFTTMFAPFRLGWGPTRFGDSRQSVDDSRLSRHPQNQLGSLQTGIEPPLSPPTPSTPRQSGAPMITQKTFLRVITTEEPPLTVC